jgi:predicted DNA-binding transcriptional regulator AlpA
MGRRVDLDDLLEAAQVAELLGLSKATAVSVYQRRYDDFPEPVLASASGRCQFWLRQDLEGWLARR